ncbi:16S rRNA (uracil(1498)-N(3))-methyltransferase [Fundidesulfovibrio soli]|uniref:16S rRNA (uracil(1498)-N(3))-methyltransferase n=1 Tax=Fundidesulfovibrio soli TaxID=2922716 RepID=UPI001FB03EBB|nr:16S rRNA (uracil(1498)-N(3))-methyltransferase [Fundidesulfovibrio soli]
MPRLDSFFLPPECWEPPFRLPGDEAKHLSKVLRLGPGAQVRCFDGQGREGLFEVEAVKGGVTLRLLTERKAPAPASRCWLALGWNKSTRRGWLLEKAVELGAAGILFWEAARSQGGMPAQPKETWQAQLVAGAKQCGNPRLPKIEMIPGGAAGLAARAAGFTKRWLLWESPVLRRGLAREDLAVQGDSIFVLGPEGGLTQGEADLFAGAGFEAVTLGPRPLRWETAALMCLGLAWWAVSENGDAETVGGDNPAAWR